ncbi:hypothetical protein GGH96_005890 [Coemansia sp. RSA 1972]|nr:hypothetical protein GGH96_005890 [Coemansia sp. RSA 1972]
MLARVAARRLGMLDQRLPTLGSRTLFHLTNTSAKPRTLFHTSAVTRNADWQNMTATEQAATFDPTLPGRVLGAWQKFTGFMSFYKEGIKALWSNRSEYRTIKRQIRQGEDVSRAEFQIYMRYPNDRLRMVPFAVLVVLAPELIYLIVLLMPGFCPSTCMTYRAMTKGARRHDKLKQRLHLQALTRIRDAGLSTRDFVDEAALTKAVRAGNRVFSLDEMSRADLALMYRFFGIGPLSLLPTSWLRTGVQRRLEYIRSDDALLYSEQLISGLGLVELFRACQERGIPAADLPEYQLRLALYNWVRLSQSQMPDNAVPVAWSRLVLLNRSVKLANKTGSSVSSSPHIVEAIVPAGDSNKVSNKFPVSAHAEVKSKSAGNVASTLGLSDTASEPARDDEPQASIVQSTVDQSGLGEANSGTRVESVQEETDVAQAESVHETDAPVDLVQETDSAQEGAEPAQEGAEPAQEGAGHEMDQAQDDGHVARFTGMMPNEMFAWIQDESARDGDPDDQAATADEDELKREDDELRTAEFASAIIAAMDDSGAV